MVGTHWWGTVCALGGEQLFLGSWSITGDGGKRGDMPSLQAEGEEQVPGRELKRYGGLEKQREEGLLEKATIYLPHGMGCRGSIHESGS